jgi:predicted transcriptional regulator
VDGVQGTLMTPADRRGPGSVVIWVKDGIIYCLAGPGGSSDAIALADSLD